MKILERARELEKLMIKLSLEDSLTIANTVLSVAPEMAELLGKLAGKLEVVIERSGGFSGCPPGLSVCPRVARASRCPDCWQEWLER